MDHRKVYFRDNLFSSDMTEIMDEEGVEIGQLYLASMFSSADQVRDAAVGREREARGDVSTG